MTHPWFRAYDARVNPLIRWNNANGMWVESNRERDIQMEFCTPTEDKPMTDTLKKRHYVHVTKQSEVDSYLESDLSSMDNVSDITIYNKDLSDKVIKGINFNGCTFEKVNLTNTRFYRCTFDMVSFKDTLFDRTRFSYCDLDDAKFEDNQTLKNVHFNYCSLGGSDFNGCTLDNVQFYHSNLTNVSLKDVTWIHKSEDTFRYCNLENVGSVHSLSMQISGQPEARYWNGKVTIGCKTHDINHWQENGKQIGKENGWIEQTIAHYMSFIERCKFYEEENNITELEKRYFVYTIWKDGNICENRSLEINNKYFDTFKEAFDYWSKMVSKFPYVNVSYFVLKDIENDKIIFTTKQD